MMISNKLIINDRILFLGIGIFLWLSVGSFSFLFQEMFKNLSFNFGLAPIFTLIIKELIRFSVYLIAVLGMVKIIKTKKLKSINSFRFLIIVLFIGQALQFVFVPIFMNNFRADDYLKNASEYYDYIQSEVIFDTIPAIVEYILYIVIGIIIYKNWNKFEIWTAKSIRN